MVSLTCGQVDPCSGQGVCTAEFPTRQVCQADNDCQSNFCALVGQERLCLEFLVFETGSPDCQNIDGK